MPDYLNLLLASAGLHRGSWMPVAADASIGVACLSMAVAVASLVRHRDELRVRLSLLCCAACILLCGTTHLLVIWELWWPDPAAQTLLKLVTAIVSAVAAVALWPLIGEVLALPSAEQLRAANSALQAEMAERLRAEAKLRQAQKLEAVGQLTRGVAHDFNNLLTVISGNVELAARALPRTECGKVESHLTTALTGVAQAKMLTDRLLAFSRRQLLAAPRPTDVNALIAGMSELLTRALGEAVEVRAVFGDVGTVEVDADRLESALLDLALQARDAMTIGDIPAGTVTIETGNVDIDGDCACRNGKVTSGRYAGITMRDTGVGPVVALEGSSDFIAEAGGHLCIAHPGYARRSVTIYLPRADVLSDVTPAAENSVVQRGHGETVLVVEDDSKVRAYVVESLREIGYRVFDAADADGALAELERLRGESAAVDVLLTDIVMPRVSGRALARSARLRHEGLRVLFMTGFVRNILSGSGRLEWGAGVISKPFTLPQLASKLRQVIEASASSAPRTKTTLLGETRC